MQNIQNVGLHEYQHPQYGDLVRSKVGELIEQGKRDLAGGLTQIKREFDIREDLMVKPQALAINVDKDGIHPGFYSDDRIMGRQFELTPHSKNQLLARAAIPQTFADRLIELKEYNLLKHNLLELIPKVSNEGLLIRNVGGVAKGILSPSYRRMDASPIFATFCEACIAAGLVPYRSRNTATRFCLTFVKPEIWQFGLNGNGKPEVVLIGLQITTSDYGASAMQVQLVILRIWCANLAQAMDILRKVHLGRRFDGFNGSDVVELSNRTISLDNRTVSSAIKDLIGSSQTHIKALAETISNATEKQVDLAKSIEALKKQGLKKEVLDRVKATYEMELPVEILPPGNTAWRLSNVLSFLANSAKDDEQLDLQAAAATVLAA